jgi:hypothetical protein
LVLLTISNFDPNMANKIPKPKEGGMSLTVGRKGVMMK